MSLLARVVTHLEAAGVPHALIGATALGLHGVSRSTDDIDLFTTDRTCLDPEFWSGDFAGEDVTVRRGQAEDPLAGVARVTAKVGGEIDLVVGKHRWQLPVTEDAVATTLDDTTVPVATPRDLVLLKLFAGGPQDAWDIESLLALDFDGDLRAAVEARLGRLPRDAQELWERLIAAR